MKSGIISYCEPTQISNVQAKREALWCGLRVASVDKFGSVADDKQSPEYSRASQSTILMVTATPKGSKGNLGRGEGANWTIQGQLRAFREDVSTRYKTEIGPDHVLMGWMG